MRDYVLMLELQAKFAEVCTHLHGVQMCRCLPIHVPGSKSERRLGLAHPGKGGSPQKHFKMRQSWLPERCSESATAARVCGVLRNGRFI